MKAVESIPSHIILWSCTTYWAHGWFTCWLCSLDLQDFLGISTDRYNSDIVATAVTPNKNTYTFVAKNTFIFQAFKRRPQPHIHKIAGTLLCILIVTGGGGLIHTNAVCTGLVSSQYNRFCISSALPLLLFLLLLLFCFFFCVCLKFCFAYFFAHFIFYVCSSLIRPVSTFIRLTAIWKPNRYADRICESWTWWSLPIQIQMRCDPNVRVYRSLNYLKRFWSCHSLIWSHLHGIRVESGEEWSSIQNTWRMCVCL